MEASVYVPLIRQIVNLVGSFAGRRRVRLHRCVKSTSTCRLFLELLEDRTLSSITTGDVIYGASTYQVESAGRNSGIVGRIDPQTGSPSGIISIPDSFGVSAVAVEADGDILFYGYDAPQGTGVYRIDHATGD